MSYNRKQIKISLEDVYRTLTDTSIDVTSEKAPNGELRWRGVLTGSEPYRRYHGHGLHAEHIFTSHIKSIGAKSGPSFLGQKGSISLGDDFIDKLRTSTSKPIHFAVADRLISSTVSEMDKETKWDKQIELMVKPEGSEEPVSMLFDVAFRIKRMSKNGTTGSTPKSSRKRPSINTASSSSLLPVGKYTITSEDGETVGMFDLGKGDHVEISEGSGPLFSKELVSSPKSSSGEWRVEETSPKRARKSGEYDDDVKVIEF